MSSKFFLLIWCAENACELFEKVLQKFPSKQEMSQQTNRDFKLLLYFVALVAVLVFESAGLEVTQEMLLLEADAEEIFMQVYSRTFRKSSTIVASERKAASFAPSDLFASPTAMGSCK